MNQQSPSPVSASRIGPVLHLTINDGKVNALSFSILDDLNAHLDEAENNDEVGAVVVSGSPTTFCAGFDLGVIRGGSAADLVSLVAGGGDLVRRFYASSVPVVAACTGHAVAAGALVLLGCDYRVGPSEPQTAKIGLNEVAIGLSLPKWALTIANDRLSRRHLQMSVANARIYDGPGATSAGFLDDVTEGDNVLEHALDHATMLAKTLDPKAYAATVQSLRGDVISAMSEQIAADRKKST